MDDRVAQIEAHGDATRRVEFQHAAQIERELSRADPGRDRQKCLNTRVCRAFAEMHESGPRFGEDTQLLRTRARLHAEQALCPAAVDVKRLGVIDPLFGEEIDLAFNTEVISKIESDSAAEA
ncbi:MAG: hypothetical protein JMDDDDMK_05461 [Acidobacteria bacterium]|nr:hypothetical protein [Acidobacteriota bacterium]